MNDSIKNLEKLTDQIYQEGIEKAEKRSKQMIQEAEEESARILQKAQAEADRVLAEAQREAFRLQKSIESELELKGKYFISDLRVKIEGLLSQKIIETNTHDALVDVQFMQSVISEILKNWNDTGNQELILPKALEDKLNGAFVNSIKKLTPNLSITFESSINAGFRIARKEDHYQISFGYEDFIEIFRTYLSEQTNRVLFNSPE